MKRSAGGAAPLQHAAAGCRLQGVRAPPHGVAGCWVVVFVVLICVLLLGCDAGQPLRRSLLDVDWPNVTVEADNVCLKSVLESEDEGEILFYKLDNSECFEIANASYSYLEVEARIFQQCSNSHEWAVLVNTEGDLPTIDEAKAFSNGTLIDYVDAEHHRFYAHLDVPLSSSTSQNWFLGFYSSCGPVQYTLKSWCSEAAGCNLSCSDPDSGPCVSLENCRCTRGIDTDVCDIDVEDLPDEEDLVTRNGLTIYHNDDTLRYGTWKYFSFQASDNKSRILVELERAYGDVILFVKPDNGDDLSEAVPNEADIQYADLSSFQNRLSYHHLFVNGSGKYYIGVYNTDHCVEEDTTFNLTITIATPSDELNLCPLNCSYPQGMCIRDDACHCGPPYGGNYCAASLWPAVPRKSFSGELQPGEWAYVNMTLDELTDNGIVSIQYTANDGHSILLAQQNRYPTLKDYCLKFSNSTLGATASDTYHINGASLNNGDLILAVFNVDYTHRGVSNYDIVIIGARKGLSIWMILLVALGSSVIVLVMMGTFRYVMQRRGQDVTQPGGLDFEATPQDLEMVRKRIQDRVMVSTLPLLAFQPGLLPKEDAGCSICLNSYSIAEIVCRLPGCKHVFHVNCLEEWFQTDDSCPLCRVPLQEQGREPSPDPLSPDLQPTIPGPSSSFQSIAEGLDQHASSSKAHYVELHQENPAPSTAKDNQPLLVKADSFSLGSSSNSECDSSSSHMPHSRETARKATCNVSPHFS